LLKEITIFIEEQNLKEEYPHIFLSEWQHELFFLCDITKHLNEVNLKLQGKNKFIWDLARTVTEFMRKLQVFKEQIKENDFSFFPSLKEIESKINDTAPYVEFIDGLIREFDSRFQDFKKYGLAFQFIKNPFTFDKN